MHNTETKSALTKQHNLDAAKPASGTKNGYELRVEIIAMAKDLLVREHQSKIQIANQNGEFLSGVEFPSVEDVLEVATKMYAFVNARH